MKKLIFVKIGGGLLTDKSKPYTLNDQFIEKIPSLFPSSILKEFDLIVGNGAGSFGHYEASQHNFSDHISNESQLLGVAKTHLAAQDLNRVVVQKLLDCQIPVFSLSPSGLFISKDNRARNLNLKPIRALLSNGFVPVVHGEVISDITRGATIFSTERIAETLLPKLRANYDEIITIILTDTDGVMCGDQLLETMPSDGSIDLSHHTGYDVTGGMCEKVASSRRLSRLGITTYICNGNNPDAIAKIISGKSVGTVFRAAASKTIR